MPSPLFTTNAAEFTRLEGLYIFEQNPPGFVRGVSLNGVAVAGECVRGPVDTPVEINSEARFLEVFGGRQRVSVTGGTIVGKIWEALLNKPFGKLVVVRAAAAAAVKSSFTAETAAGGGGTAVLRVDASSVGAWGDDIAFKVQAASDAVGTHFDLVVRYNGSTVTYKNLNINGASDDNTLEVLGDDIGNHITLAKLANGRPVNHSAGVDGADADGFVNLGEVVAGFVSVAGSDGSIADTDFTAAGRAIDKIKEYKGVGVVFIANRANATINGALETAAAASSDRLFLIWNGTHGASVSTVAADAANYRLDRIVYCYNSPYTLDPETATLIQVPPDAWMASILSQIDVDIHPGEEDTKKFTAGISKLTDEGLARGDYITLREAGVCALEKDEGFVFVSGVTTDLTPGKTEITRRRSADFLQLSLAGRLKNFVKKKNTEERRAQMAGEITAFSDDLRDQGRIVEEYEVEIDVTTPTQRAQGLEFIVYRVRLIGHILFLVLKTEIGTGVVIEEAA